MADTLEWMNKHLVLLRYLAISEIAAKEQYTIRADLEKLYEGVDNAETMVYKFASLGLYKEAAELFAYIGHKRAAVWWVYRCVLDLLEELSQNPAAERDIADIGASFDTTVPDFAKVDIPKADPAQVEAAKKSLADLEAEYQKARASVDPEIMSMVDEAMDAAYKVFEKAQGVHPLEVLKKLAAKVGETQQIDPNSPLFQEAAKLKAKLAAVQKETVDTIKSVLPPKVPAREKKLRDDALGAVWRWIAAPDAENSQKCFELGNTCPGTPAGLLAMSAFWAFGDLMPTGKQPVPTPGGLAPNGLVQTLLLCALHKGGTRNVKERYEQYFQMGVDVFTGKETWADALELGKAPHEALDAEPRREAPRREPPPGDALHGNTGAEKKAPPKYERWK